MDSVTSQAEPNLKEARESKLPERRSKRRYPLALEMVFRPHGGEGETTPILGTTVNISSGGILFETHSELKKREVVHMAIRWPVRLDDRSPLQILVNGRVVRRSECHTAVEIVQYEFRVAGTNGLAL